MWLYFKKKFFLLNIVDPEKVEALSDRGNSWHDCRIEATVWHRNIITQILNSIFFARIVATEVHCSKAPKRNLGLSVSRAFGDGVNK